MKNRNEDNELYFTKQVNCKVFVEHFLQEA